MPKLRPNSHVFVDSPDKFLYTTWLDPQTLKFAPSGFNEKDIWNCDLKKGQGVQVKDCPNVLYFQRNNQFSPETFLTENTFNWGSSSKFTEWNGVTGARSVMLVAIKLLYIMGFRKIYLVGCDFNMSEDNKYAFNQDRKASAIHNNNKTYKQMNERMTLMRPMLEQFGLEIFNCCNPSGLTAFDYKPFGEAIDESLSHVPDVRQFAHGRLEDVAGLYETKWYICPDCKTHARYSKEDCKAEKCQCKCGRIVTHKDRKKYCK